MADETDAPGHAVGDDEPEGPQHGDAGEHVVEAPVPHPGVADDEPPELGKESGQGRPVVSRNVHSSRCPGTGGGGTRG